MAVWEEPSLPRILIEGDSWADHPLVSNLGWSLHQYLKNQAHFLNISSSGDLIYDMARGKQFRKLKAYLKSSVFNFDLLFLSGGGNDILVNENDKYKLSAFLQTSSGNDPQSYIKEDVWNRSLGRVEQSYTRILEMASEVSPTLKIVTHSYDYIYPRNISGDIIVIPDVLGPWVWPVMRRKGITEQELQRKIIAYLLDQMKLMLDSLAGKYSQLTIVDTLGTLPTYENWGVNVPHWEDEIHPDSKGFAKLVNDKIGPVIKNLM